MPFSHSFVQHHFYPILVDHSKELLAHTFSVFIHCSNLLDVEMIVASLRYRVRAYFFMAFALFGSGFLPFWSIICPRYLILSIRIHFSGPSLKLFSLILLNTFRTCFLCSSVFSLFISMSSKYATANSRPARIASMICLKWLGSTLSPNRRRLRAYTPQCVWMVKYLEHFSSTLTCRYASDKSILENVFPPLSLEKCLLEWEEDSYDLLNSHLGPLKKWHRLVFFSFLRTLWIIWIIHLFDHSEFL